MKKSEDTFYREESHKDGKVSVEVFDTQNQAESLPKTQKEEMNGGQQQPIAATNDSSISEEQRERVEKCMKEVKIFIRNIDVNSL